MPFTDEGRQKALSSRREYAQIRDQAIQATKTRFPHMTLRAIGAKLGCSHDTVRRALVR